MAIRLRGRVEDHHDQGFNPDPIPSELACCAQVLVKQLLAQMQAEPDIRTSLTDEVTHLLAKQKVQSKKGESRTLLLAAVIREVVARRQVAHEQADDLQLLETTLMASFWPQS